MTHQTVKCARQLHGTVTPALSQSLTQIHHCIRMAIFGEAIINNILHLNESTDGPRICIHKYESKEEGKKARPQKNTGKSCRSSLLSAMKTPFNKWTATIYFIDCKVQRDSIFMKLLTEITASRKAVGFGVFLGIAYLAERPMHFVVNCKNEWIEKCEIGLEQPERKRRPENEWWKRN